jgi:hypothetical protein
MPNILSIDVGIKNLSFCLLRLNNEQNGQNGQNREIEILKWNTLNLNDALNTDADTDTGTDVITSCTCKIGCKLKPYYVYTQENNVVYACKRHYKTLAEPSRRVFENKPPSYISKVLKTFTAENLREFCKEYSFNSENTNANANANESSENVKSNKQELKMKALTVLRTEYVYPISTHASCISILQFPDQKEEQIQQKQQIQKKNKNLSHTQTQAQASTVSLVFVGYSLMKQFDELFYNENCPDQNKNKIDTVVIENQISPIANRMKTVQGMITQYFLMRGVDKNHIIYFSSVQKLKVAPYYFVFHDTSDNDNASEVDDIQTYDDRKKAGVACVRKILAASSTSSTSSSMTGSGSSPFTIQSNECTHSNAKLCSCWLHRFESHKKKDDMADSFLQGLSYLVKTVK